MKAGETLTVDEAAQLLRVHRETVLRALRAGRLPGGKVGGQWRIPAADLEAHLRGGGPGRAEANA